MLFSLQNDASPSVTFLLQACHMDQCHTLKFQFWDVNKILNIIINLLNISKIFRHLFSLFPRAESI